MRLIRSNPRTSTLAKGRGQGVQGKGDREMHMTPRPRTPGQCIVYSFITPPEIIN